MSTDKQEQRSSAAHDLDVNDLIIENDTGARELSGFAGKVLLCVTISWAIFQLWIVSPIGFQIFISSALNIPSNILILNDTESRSIHLAFATFLAYIAFPTFRNSPRKYAPIQDWVMGIVAAFCSGYLYLFYRELATRPGMPTDMDIYVAVIGIVLLLEAARRSLGLPLMIMGIIFLSYTFFGSASWMPELVAHKGQSLNKVASHQWLSTEGVFGVALGVSSGFVFLFVLFGALLDKAGAGNYFIKVAFSLLGHLRGGPAKAAVLSSGMTGFISGSSIANTVTTGTFTIPLMKRVGFSSEKAGAVEVAGSVNGQIMPPVMGAAAFIMVEYVGIPYQDVVKHAFLPAVISYIALLYMVHLEALKQNLQALPKPVRRTRLQSFLVFGITVSSMVILACVIYYVVNFIKNIAGDATPYVIGIGIMIAYVLMVKFAAKYPDLEVDDPNSPVVKLPETAPTVKTGLHYVLPVIMLIWCLMVERLSPGLSAFWACIVMMIILVTQRVLFNYFRGIREYKPALKKGLLDLRDGLVAGSRNMIGIGVATAAAGIIVGTVSLTGIGQVMTEIVGVLSGGSLIMVLVYTAIISLILGMGLPTTANYIVVASIMVTVVQELGVQHGLIVPVIAIHLFVFYFGIMADVTPPVGLASFAAAAISKGDPIRTGVQAFLYSTRTAILPFFFIFNNELLLIGINGFWYGVFVFVIASIAIMLFSAAMQGYFITRNRFYESLLLLLVSVALFVPSMFMNKIYPPYEEFAGSEIEKALEQHAKNIDEFKLFVLGEGELGEPKEFYTVIDISAIKNRDDNLLKSIGLTVEHVGKAPQKTIISDIEFDSIAEKAGLDFEDEIRKVLIPQPQPSEKLVYIPAFLLLLLIIFMQRARRGTRVICDDNTSDACMIR